MDNNYQQASYPAPNTFADRAADEDVNSNINNLLAILQQDSSNGFIGSNESQEPYSTNGSWNTPIASVGQYPVVQEFGPSMPSGLNPEWYLQVPVPQLCSVPVNNQWASYTAGTNSYAPGSAMTTFSDDLPYGGTPHSFATDIGDGQYEAAPILPGSYHNADHSTAHVSHPHGGDGIGLYARESAVVEEVTAPPVHMHYREKKKDFHHDCKYDGKEPILARSNDGSGFADLVSLYQRLGGRDRKMELRTENFDRTILRSDEAHGIDNGDYVCRARGSVVRMVNPVVPPKWVSVQRPCNVHLKHKQSYRRHLIEEHFGLRRPKGTHMSIADRAAMALGELQGQVQPTKRKRTLDDNGEASSEIPANPSAGSNGRTHSKRRRMTTM